MTLINTKGMAFIGPGSEWFWAALQFTALAITFVAIYRQLRIARSQRAVEQVEGYKREWNGERMDRYRLAVLVAVRDETEIPYGAGLVVANYFEDMAILRRGGHLDIKLLWEYLGVDSEIWWIVLASVVQRSRALLGAVMHSDWERLNGQFVGMDRRAGGLATIDAEFVTKYLAGPVIERLRDRIRIEQSLRTVTIASPDGLDTAQSAASAPAPSPSL